MKRVVVVGGGISGLTCAWEKQKDRNNEVTLVEASNRVGGWIRTVNKEGFLFECGPRGCRPKGGGLETLGLIEELGLIDEVLFANEHAYTRYLYYRNRLQKVPSSLFSSCFSPLMKGARKALWREWRTAPTTADDESITSFMERRLSKEWVDRFIDPLVTGIYAGDPSKLSIRSCFPLFWQWEQEHGSLIKGGWKHRQENTLPSWAIPYRKRGLFSFRKGMETLPKALLKQLRGPVLLSTAVQGIKRCGQQWTVLLSNQDSIIADEVHFNLPLHVLSSITYEGTDIDPPLFSTIPANSVATVHLGFWNAVLPMHGFGYLAPRSEKQSILGMIWDSETFPEQSHTPEQTRLTVMIGDTQKSDGDLVSVAIESLKNHLGIAVPPDFVHLARAREAIPQYPVGYHLFLSKIREIEDAYKGSLYFGGNGFAGVGVNDCISYTVNRL